MIMWVILVAIGAIVTPLLAEFAEIAYNATNSTTTQIISQAIVPFFWLGVIITFFMFVSPQLRPREFG
jgi:hypothetical protein